MGLYAIVTFATAWVLGYKLEQVGFAGVLVLNQVLVATVLYLRSNIAGAQLYTTDSLLSVLDRVLLIGLVGWLLWVRYAGVPSRSKPSCGPRPPPMPPPRWWPW